MSPLPKKAHWPPFYIYLQSALMALVVWYMTHARYQDDAYISLTYARHLLEGNGLTWNPGEHVEGYSNFLFIIVTALLGWLGMDLVHASLVISFVSYFALLAVMHSCTMRHYRAYLADTPHAYAHSINNALCIGMVGSSVIVLTWCLGGLETVMFATLLTFAVCLILRWLDEGINPKQCFLAGILFALAALTRMEGLMLWGVTGLFLGVLWLRKKNPRVNLSQLMLLAAGFLVVYGPYVGWRMSYFNDWLPNTYYSKLYGIPPDILFFHGFFYFLQFLIMPPMLMIFALALLYMVRRIQPLPHVLLYLFILVTVFCIFVVKSGGDHMNYLRFFVPVVSLLALIIYYASGIIIPRNEKRFRDICGALIVLLVFQFGMVRTDETLSAGAASGEAVADYVNQHWPKGSLVAINPAGALPYFAPNFRYIDMLGLMDSTIAHRSFLNEPEDVIGVLRGKVVGHMKGDGHYVLSRQPDYIIFGNAVWGTEQPIFVSDKELDTLSEFHTQYQRVVVYVTPPAHLLPTLQSMAEENSTKYEKAQDKHGFNRGPVMNKKGQLRFIYWKRISTAPSA